MKYVQIYNTRTGDDIAQRLDQALSVLVNNKIMTNDNNNLSISGN